MLVFINYLQNLNLKSAKFLRAKTAIAIVETAHDACPNVILTIQTIYESTNI